MEHQQPTGKIVFAIERAGNLGFVCTLGGKPDGHGPAFDAATSTLPELFEWMAAQAAASLGALPYRPPAVLQQPAPPQPRPMAPPPRPMEGPPPIPDDGAGPIPHGIIPDEANRLAERIKASQRTTNGLVSMIAVMPLAIALVLSSLWPFGV
jgi:hypothetical protein